ncbi:hypothetical protein N0V93_003399 [Gnomoniopsis smithogilvyi]|uniref:Cyanovirin-N domain-containing protein n=1 Tax=Gnomoniopsis smithogilvyi TaxID=1191159 RepID=A0A9W9CZU0_9PEZI|nr:hypothetical protein N0V93_003399 [Gnomoniopsis smithogilvyi]
MISISTILTGLVFLGPVLTKSVAIADLQGVQSFSPSLTDPVLVNQSCTVGSYTFDTQNATLGVYCNTDDLDDFAYDWTFIDLNLCIGNNNGSLASSPEGNFSDTCEGCNITWSHVDMTPVTTTFTTTPYAWVTNAVTRVSTPRWDDLYFGCGGCTNRDYQLNPTTVDLNKIMVNDNGTIGCHMYKGTAVHVKPEPTTAMTAATPGLVAARRSEIDAAV